MLKRYNSIIQDAIESGQPVPLGTYIITKPDIKLVPIRNTPVKCVLWKWNRYKTGFKMGLACNPCGSADYGLQSLLSITAVAIDESAVSEFHSFIPIARIGEPEAPSKF